MVKVQATIFVVLLPSKLHKFSMTFSAKLKTTRKMGIMGIFEIIGINSQVHYSFERNAKMFPISPVSQKTSSRVKNYELQTRYRCLSIQKGSDYEF